MNSRSLLAAAVIAMSASLAQAQNAAPILRLEAGGPTSNVTSMAFSPDGNILYAAGFDKVVRVWRIDADTGKFVLDPATSFRVPILPGTQGAINALALSPDGNWLAVGGLGIVSVGAGFDETGKLWPTVGAITPEMRLQQGTIYLFHTQKREVKPLRGHRGPILSLTFAPGANDELLLASTALGWDGATAVGEARLWNADTGKDLGTLDLPEPRSFRPGLAILPGAPTQVAIAWGDPHKRANGQTHGLLRLWNVATGDVTQIEDGYENVSLAFLENILISGSFEKNKGQIQGWQAGAKGLNKVDRFELKAPASSYLFPRSLSTFTPDHLAVVSWLLKKTGEEAMLELFDVSADGFGRQRAQVPLWAKSKLNPMDPLVAASRTGRHIAVAGNAEHEIWIFDVAKTLAKKKGRQILRSVGSSYDRIAFVDQAGSKIPGLLLRHTFGDAQDAMVFDFSQSKLTSAEGWQVQTPKAAGWSLSTLVNNTGTTIKVLRNGKAKGETIHLPDDHRLNASAILPPQAPWNVPLVILGTYLPQKGEVLLEVFNGKTGQKIRRLDGHLAGVSALALSADGKLLASAANDQTVAVWSLADLGEIVDKFGALPGVSVNKSGGQLVVAQVDADSPAAGTLKKGQVILGLVDPAKEFKPIATPFAFYESLWRSKPGTVVTLKLKDADDVQLTVGQGVDVRKALLSLFVAHSVDGKHDWLGWNATGPFESSKQTIEKYLGWHFNPTQTKEPAQFAQIDQYRKKYYKEGILKHLVMQANLPTALDAWDKEKNPPEAMRPAPRILDGIGADRADNGELVFRQLKNALNFALANYDARPGDEILWQKDDGPLQPAEASDDNVWSIPLDKVFKTPGRHKVRLVVRLRHESLPMAEYSREVTARLQNAPPEITVPALNVTATQAEFAFSAKVASIHPGQKVDIELAHRLSKQLLGELKTPGVVLDNAYTFKKTITLKEGENLVQVSAVNTQPLAGLEDAERTTVTVRLVYNPKAPSLVLETIQPVVGKEVGDKQPIKPGQVMRVDTPTIRVLGSIKSEEELGVPEYDLGPGSERIKIVVPAQAKEFALAVDVPLTPGPQKVRFFAAAGGKETSQTVDVVYAPALPHLVLTSPAPNSVIRETDDKDTREITVQAKFVPAVNASSKPFPLKVRALVNGKETGNVKLDADKVEVTSVQLQPGNNVIQLQAKSPWSTQPAQAEVQMRYLRPPTIVSLKSQAVGADPFVHLTAEISSPLPPLPESVKVEIHGKTQKFGKAIVTGKARRWTVEVRDVPLDVDENKDVNENKVHLTLANAEDVVKDGATLDVTYKLPPPPRPTIHPQAPEVVLKEPEYRLKFQVESRKPLKQLAVSLGKKVVYEADPAKLTARDKGVYDVDVGLLALDWGSNELKIEAVNPGGVTSKSVVVTVPPWPVQIDMDRLEVEGSRPQTLKATMAANGKLTFPKANDGRTKLVGKIRWSSRDDAEVKKTHHVKIYVNGYQQVPARLSPFVPGERVRTFEIPLRLPFADNHVEMVLPELVQDSSNRTQFDVGCLSPAKGQQLHVVIVAPEERDEKKLRDQFLTALEANPLSRDKAKSGAFEAIHFYAFTSYVELLPVLSRLHQLGRNLKNRAADGSPNDVVMVYYWGKQTPVKNERYLWTSETDSAAQVRGTALSLGNLSKNFFDNFPGAQIVLLDLFDEKQPTPPLSDSRFALLCHSSREKSTGTFRFPLLSELERAMPKSTWLREDLVPALARGLDQASFLHHLPANLNIRWHTPRQTGAR